MMLSTEQTRAVMHGLDNRLTWREIERPVGPQPIPDWCKGAHVRWREGYGNSPDVLLKVRGYVRDWPNKRFVLEGGRYYRARHEDGRMEQYAHGGAVRLDKVHMFQSADGSEIVLRGPWHVGAPEGYAEVAFVDINRWKPWKGQPWHATGGMGGLYLRHDTFVAIMARFCPELPLAEVTYGGATTIEPMKPEWCEPKRLVYEREWRARQAEHDAGKVAEARS
ncbi:hypothetical protein [Bosea sp. ASV33]|uniref:hypothetical protein n=1 Tax=Bosea sp. ASV33 TaxID=2795106 RepID=UPI0018ED4730|nr:hypothetical protein [Bosea sp. ASV33]